MKNCMGDETRKMAAGETAQEQRGASTYRASTTHALQGNSSVHLKKRLEDRDIFTCGS